MPDEQQEALQAPTSGTSGHWGSAKESAGPYPTVGRIVHYELAADDAEQINRRRQHAWDHMAKHRAAQEGVQVHVGNSVEEGRVVAGVIVAVWGSECVNLKVLLDGTDDFWATSVMLGTGPQTWRWPPRG